MPSLITDELAELRCPERVINGRWIFVIGQIIHSDTEREPAMVKLEPALKVHIEIEIYWKAPGICTSYYVSLRILY